MARRALADCDIVIGAVDRDEPRLVLAWMAAYHHLVLLDFGTGVHRREPTGLDRQGEEGLVVSGSPRVYTRRMGGDVRLILPGDRCLLCYGGLAHHREAIGTLISGRESLSDDRELGQYNRSGSLRSINQLATAVGVTLLLDLAAGRIIGSRWTQIEWDDVGRLGIMEYQDPPARSMTDCILCARAGRGDDPIEAI